MNWMTRRSSSRWLRSGNQNSSGFSSSVCSQSRRAQSRLLAFNLCCLPGSFGNRRSRRNKQKVDISERGPSMDQDEELAEGLEDVAMAANSVAKILREGWEKLESYHDEVDKVNEELTLYKDSLDDCTRELKRLNEKVEAGQATSEITESLTADIQKAIIKSRLLLEKIQQILHRPAFWEGLCMLQETFKVLKARQFNFPLEDEPSGVVPLEINPPEDTETNPAVTWASTEGNVATVALDFMEKQMVLEGLMVYMRLKQREFFGAVPSIVNAPKDTNPEEANVLAPDALAIQLKRLCLEWESSGVVAPEISAPEDTVTNAAGTDISAEANVPADASVSGHRDDSEETHIPAGADCSEKAKAVAAYQK